MSALAEADRRQRHSDFLKMAPADRPLVGSFLFGYFMNEQYPNLSEAIPDGPITPDDINVDLFLQDCERLYQAYEELDDDYPYIGGAFFGVPWMEAIMGGRVISSPGSMWVEPVIEAWDDWHWERPSLDTNPWARKLLQLVEALVEHSNGRYPVGPTLMRGPGDILSALRGPARLPLDYYDRPDAVRRAAELCADVWIEVGKAQLARVPASTTGYACGCHGLRVWAPDKIIWLQDDALALQSPRFYHDFFRGQHRRIASEFPRVGFHLHGTVLWPVDELLAMPEIDVLQLGYESLVDFEESLAVWKKVQGQTPLVIWADFNLPDFWSCLETILDELPPAGISFQTTVPSLELALQVKERVMGSTAT